MAGSAQRHLPFDEARKAGSHGWGGDDDGWAKLTSEVTYWDCPCAGDAMKDSSSVDAVKKLQWSEKKNADSEKECDSEGKFAGKKLSHTTPMQKQHALYEADTNGDAMLLKKIADMEVLIKQMNKEKKKMEKLHIMEIRARDKKELRILLVFLLAAIVYVVIAMMTRGFV
jgi:hypothetical protein